MSKNTNQKEYDDIASSLEEYLEIVDRFMILTEITPERYEKAVKIVRKAIKKLRKGEIDGVLDKREFGKYLACKKRGENYYADFEEE